METDFKTDLRALKRNTDDKTDLKPFKGKQMLKQI